MKSLKCDLCDFVADGETFEDWMNALRPHYMEAHADVMSDPNHTKEDMEKWMAENKARFDSAYCDVQAASQSGHWFATKFDLVLIPIDGG